MNVKNSINFNLIIILFFLFVIPGSVKGFTIEFKGNNLPVIEIKPDKNSGLDALFITNTIQNLSIELTSTDSQSIECSIFSNMGAAYAEKIELTEGNNHSYIISNPKGNIGYIIEDEKTKYYFWLIDYNSFPNTLNSITPSMTQECDQTIIEVNGEASPIYYYNINGRREILSRDIILSYNNLEWNEDKETFIQEKVNKNLESISSKIIIIPPVLCQTEFELKSDKFQQIWGDENSIISNIFYPNAVEAYIKAVQEENIKESSNIINGTDNESLGGSAPATIDFYSYVSDAVVHYEWQMSKDENFDIIDYRINDQDFTYTFEDEGTVFIKFIGSNSDGSCESESEILRVNIGNSELLIPNAFTPNDDGINDIWKVSYRSLLEFKCWIFDRNGHQLYYFTDPSQGWDGKKNGKTVRSGVYFYVIEALGSDGKKYKKSGDINILNSREENRNYSNID